MQLCLCHLVHIFLYICISARLEGMLLEAKGAWAEAERAYAVILENNPNEQVLYLL
jgi:hypothetical protein